MRRRGNRPHGVALLLNASYLLLIVQRRIHVDATWRQSLVLPLQSSIHQHGPGSMLYLRGGGPNEVNPEYYFPVASTPTRAPFSSFSSREHVEWCHQQQPEGIGNHPNRYANSKDYETPSNEWQQPSELGFRLKKSSNLDTLQAYSKSLYKTSPTAYWTTMSCLLVFLLWQVAPQLPLLHELFLCSRLSIQRTKGLSLIMASFSHKSFNHLLVNLMTFLQLAPKIVRDLGMKSVSNLSPSTVDDTQPLWPLLLGSAVCSNILFALFRAHGSCLGLSGVTMAMFAVFCSSNPKQQLAIYFLPVGLQANAVLLTLLIASLLGSFANSSPICHLGHLGGLLYGLAYYHLGYRHRGAVVQRLRVIKRQFCRDP